MNETTTMTVPAKTPHPVTLLRDRLQTRIGELRAALPPDISELAVIRAVLTSAAINPDLYACSFPSIWIAIMKSCRDALLPDGVEAALVPFKSNVTYVPMYQGLLKNFRRSGQFVWVKADIVREGDQFRHYVDEKGEHIYHESNYDFEAPIKLVYAAALTKEAHGFHAAVLPIKEADKIRKVSKNTRDDAPWRQWPEEMYKKTALRRLAKVLPTARDIMHDDQLDDDGENALASAPPAAPRDQSAIALALDQIASTPAPSDGPSAARTTAAEPSEERASGPAQVTGTAPAGAPIDQIGMAYEQGKQAKRAGQLRKALPGELRAPERAAEVQAWQAGWDGAPCPSATGSLV